LPILTHEGGRMGTFLFLTLVLSYSEMSVNENKSLMILDLKLMTVENGYFGGNQNGRKKIFNLKIKL
jgi:hypothetical protein